MAIPKKKTVIKKVPPPGAVKKTDGYCDAICKGPVGSGCLQGCCEQAQ